MNPMRIFIEANPNLPNVVDSYTRLFSDLNRILLDYRTPGIFGAGFIALNQPDIEGVIHFVQERIRGIKVPNSLGVSLSKAPKAALRDIDALPVLGSNPNLVIMMPWKDMDRLHRPLNIGTAGSKFPRPDELGNEVAYLLGSKR